MEMKNCNIVFMGTPEIAVSMLDRILQDGYQVLAVVTQPDKKAGRKQELKMPEVKVRALAEGIRVLQPLKIKDAMEELLQMDIDLIVTCAYGQFIPEAILQHPTYGSINVHASLLPKLRGGAPIHKAIMYGEEETGMSIMRMVKAMDAGAVMAQCSVKILSGDTTGDLYDRLSIAGAQLLSESIPKLLDGSASFIEQDEAKATFAYTISKEEEYIEFSKPITTVYNHIRALIPFPIGHATINGKKFKFHKVRMIQDDQVHENGKVIGMMQDALAIACQGGYLLLDEVQLEGKAKSDAKSFFNGAGRSLVGQCFISKDEENV